MKYDKVNAEVIRFDDNEIFTLASGDVSGGITAATQKWGLDYINCGTVNYQGGKLICNTVSYQKTGNYVVHHDDYQTWTVS